MCAMTNPTRTTPVTAITTFLPTMVPHNATTGLAGQNPRFVAGFGRSSIDRFLADALLHHLFDPRRHSGGLRTHQDTSKVGAMPKTSSINRERIVSGAAERISSWRKCLLAFRLSHQRPSRDTTVFRDCSLEYSRPKANWQTDFPLPQRERVPEGRVRDSLFIRGHAY